MIKALSSDKRASDLELSRYFVEAIQDFGVGESNYRGVRSKWGEGYRVAVMIPAYSGAFCSAKPTSEQAELAIKSKVDPVAFRPFESLTAGQWRLGSPPSSPLVVHHF